MFFLNIEIKHAHILTSYNYSVMVMQLHVPGIIASGPIVELCSSLSSSSGSS